ncbi:MAG: SMP-30/gluconolactonase/LRE family protein [Deltaproteobacteria bacterium]|nr:SMP-30/gluconolactonase/LRE family protein [Deltaproteobacteria bacterium]MBW2550182.1 SMP-30/gluconolactonase/LRE family protein [Deltaproteobacteria bacterium]
MIGLRDLGALILVGVLSGCGSSSDGGGGAAGAGGTGGAGGAEAPLQDQYVLSDQELVPESGTFDPTSRSFYVGSATRGNITRVEADGTESILFTPPGSETWRTLGMTADDAARRLWVCAQRMDEVASEIWVFDLDSGNRDLVLNLADAAADSTCNDIAVDSASLAYISDSGNPRVYRADAGAETVMVWADDPLLSPNSGGTFGGNGIAVTEDDSFVIVSKTSTGAPPRLLRIAHDDPSSIGELVATPALEGFADGMSFLDGDLYIAMVASGNVARLTSDDDWATASVVIVAAEPGAPVPGISTVRPAEGVLYAIYSDITSNLLGIDPTPPFRIFKVDLTSFE